MYIYMNIHIHIYESYVNHVYVYMNHMYFAVHLNTLNIVNQLYFN